MRWPWQRAEAQRETRAAGGGYTDALVAALVAEAEGTTAAKATTTAALETAAGALSRIFAGCTVEGPEWAREAVDGPFLSLVGRDLVRRGESLHAIRYDAMGRLRLIPCSDWDWQEGGPDPSTWTVRATAYGPSASMTWRLPAASVISVCWGTESIRPYRGVGPAGFASLAARQTAETERSLADESAGPLAQLLAIPSDGGDGGDDDPLKKLKADIKSARGKAAFVETTAAGWQDGAGAAPRRDWIASRLGPSPPAALVELARDAFMRTLAACGHPPDLAIPGDSQGQREALRRHHMTTVLPLARMLERELSAKLEARIRLRFDSYPLDIQGRAAAFAKLTMGDKGLTQKQAMTAIGLLFEDDG